MRLFLFNQNLPISYLLITFKIPLTKPKIHISTSNFPVLCLKIRALSSKIGAYGSKIRGFTPKFRGLRLKIRAIGLKIGVQTPKIRA